MAKLIIHQEKIKDPKELTTICPFGAMEEKDGKVSINAACKMCRLCVKKGPAGAVEYVEEKEKKTIDKSQWNGIAVYVDHVDGEIHPVTYELIGKARELAAVIKHPVYALFMGSKIKEKAEELLHYGVDKVFVYDNPQLDRFKIEPYTAVFEDFIEKQKPSAILTGATTVGRQLAPRVAARMKTGLTADCTILEMDKNTDLSQIRPAFGGNIMAHILTPNNRPQMATVRYKVMNAPERMEETSGEIISCEIDEEKLKSNVEVLDIVLKEQEQFIESADVLVVAGRGVKKEEDLAMIQELADLMKGQLACTRPLVEAGWVDAKRQVGLSGRTVRPKLIITCGVSGAIQFVAGMNHSDCIISIDSDEKAPIFKTAHYCLVGDLYEIIPKLIEKVKAAKGA
ncbi:electron transfer flavoprotein subunit alpha [Anaerostipes sp. 494a]|uniref:electron transfer flavoprotein subunit alpha n=1 Tax=Anaerostipes TaxID=207244 RepID=UPI000950BC70|nr:MULTISPECIES: electron transfer flavoprotein subunit alpha/FixB family protein [Anaerostipes]MCI5624095.1 FAD-binding protein [Anaerostipes sp.]MDY2725846.1 FAD-binding protein [Anaerostipes faecalis]OLR58180.1 electron transfer flavoprotein subunit alpha [Anaerostipes sp. 494a]